LFCENQVMKVEFCQCRTVLVEFCQASCSGLTRVYDQSLTPLICCASPSSVNWFTLFSRWRFYLLPLTTSGGRMKGEHCSLLCRSGHTTRVRITWIFSTRVYTLLYARSCSACRLHLFAVRLDRIQLSSGHKKLPWFLFESTPLDWTYFRLKTATFKFWSMINLRLSRRSSPRGPERNLLGVKCDHDDSGKTPAD